MFAPARQSSSAAFSAGASAYRQVGVQTGVNGANPHQLVTMLFDGLVDNIIEARGAMRQGQIDQKGRAIGRAVRIVEEGLKSCLDMKAGGKLSLDLHDLYSYMILQLTKANRFNDEAHLDECQKLIEPVRAAWNAIGSQVISDADR